MIHQQSLWQARRRRISSRLGGCWRVLALVCLGLGCLAFGWGWFTSESVISSSLIIRTPTDFPGPKDLDGLSIAPLRLDAPALAVTLSALPVLQKMAENSDLAIAAKELKGRVQIEPVTNADLLQISYHSRHSALAVQWINAFAQTCVQMSTSFQQKEIEKHCRLLQDLAQAAQQEADLLKRELFDFQNQAGPIDYANDYGHYHNQLTVLSQQGAALQAQLANLDTQIKALLEELAKNTPALVTAKEALDQALLRYTEEHPKVKELRAAAAYIEKQLQEEGPKLGPEVLSKGNPVVSALYAQLIELRQRRLSIENQVVENKAAQTAWRQDLSAFPEKQKQFQSLKAKHQAAEARCLRLNQRREAIQLRQQANPAWLEVFDPARVQTSHDWARLKRSLLGGGIAALLTFLLIFFITVKQELQNRLIRDESDLQIASQLPILGKLPDLATMDTTDREQWAFWTLRQLQNRLAPNTALICGFTSAMPGEGRSTWMNLLASAARKQGLWVVCLDARSPSTRNISQATSPNPDESSAPSQALLSPGDILEIVKTPALCSSIQADFDGWIWSLEKRNQWQSGMAELGKLNNLVLFTALPTASEPLTALLAEPLPHVIWISAQGESDRFQTRDQVKQLINGRIRLAGAVLNKAKS